MSMIDKLERFIKRAEEDELDKDMRPEAIFALKAAVKAVGHNYQSLEECLMGTEVYEEAEALYFEPEDEFPLKYIAALKGVALVAEESEGGDDLPPLPGMPGPLPMEEDARVSLRKQKIEKEVKEYVKQAEEQELDKEMRAEGVQALHIAAQQLAYKMKAFDDNQNKQVAFPSLAALLVGVEIYEIAEKHYYDPEDEYPLKYISALREVGMIAGGYDEDVDEMESRGQAIDSDDEVFEPPKPRTSGGRKRPAGAGRKAKIEKEVREYVKQAEEGELDKEMREEGVKAVIKAANKMAYKKKWRDEVLAKWVVFPSIKALLVRTEIYEEAEKYYYDPGDEFPLKYISALKEVAIVDGGFDEEIEEMEEDGAVDIGSDDEMFSGKTKLRSVKERMSIFEAPKTPRKDPSSPSPLVGRKRFGNRAFNQRMSMYTMREDEREEQRKKLLDLKIHNKKGVENIEKDTVGNVSDKFNSQMQQKEEEFKQNIQEIQDKRKRLRDNKNRIREDKNWERGEANVHKRTRSNATKKRIIPSSSGGTSVWTNVRATKLDIDYATWKAPMNLPEPTQQQEQLISDAMKDSVLFHPHRDVDETKQALVHAFETVDVKKGEEIKGEGTNDNFFYLVQEGSVDINMNGKVVGSASTGEHFGELNLLYANDPSQPRQKFNLVANESSTLMRLNQAVFREVIQVQTKRDEDVKRAYLRKVPFLRNLLFDGKVEKNKQTTTRLLSIMNAKNFKKGDKIVDDGAKPEDSLFIIKEGTLQLTSDKNDVFHLAAGSYIGKRALMGTKGKEPNVKDLEGLVDGSLFQIDKDAVNKVLGENFFARQFDVAQDKKKLEGFQCIKSVNLDPAMMHEIAENIEDQTFEEGKQILEEGADTEPCLYLVREGFVILSTNNGDFKQKVGPGGYFGVEQLLVPKDKSKENQNTEKVLVPAQWSVKVTGDVPCVCGVLPLQDVQAVMDGEGSLADKFNSSGFDLVLQPDEKEPEKVEEEKKKPPARAASLRKPKIKSACDTPVGTRIVKERLRQREIVKKKVTNLDDLEMLSVLGDGEFGEVWLVKAAGNDYALKMQQKTDEDVEESIEREIAVTQELCHPNVVNLVTTYDAGNKVYMLLGLVPGGELWELIYREDDDGNWKSGLPEFDSKFYALSVADTLNWLHSKRYVYRDLKPENVMIDGEGYPVVVDFGFAKTMDEGLTFTFCGTPNYVAPEIVQNEGHDAGVDHWALGVLIYEMLSGEHPFFYEGMHQMEVFEAICQNKHYKLQTENVDPSAHKIIDGLLEKDRNQRLGMLAGKGDDILGHEWFKEIDLLKLRNRKITAPMIPEKK